MLFAVLRLKCHQLNFFQSANELKRKWDVRRLTGIFVFEVLLMLRMGPRVIDLDILFYGSDVVRINKVDGLDDLVIPHERLQERGFVLKPMCDIAPGILYLF